MIHAVLAALLVLGPAVSTRESVQALAQRADAAFAAGDFAGARAALLEALALEPDNLSLVFGLAQAERFLDNCPRAVELFDRFLLADPPEEQAAAARAKRAECTDAPPPEPEPERAVDPEPPPPSSFDGDPTPPPASTKDRPPVAGPVLVGIGSGLALVGVVLVAAAFGTAAGAPDARTQDDYRAREGRVIPLAAAGWTGLGVGVAMAIAGGIAWGIAKRRRAVRR